MTDFDIQAVIDTAQRAVDPVELDLGNVYAVATANGDVKTLDLTGDQYRDQPKRKTGTIQVRDVPTLAEVWMKHGVADISEIYADRDGLAVTAVFDAHGREETGWGKYRAVLALKFSEAYKAWTGLDGRLMPQEQFAEFLEDNRADIREPSAAELLEVAQTLQGTSKVDWQAGHRLVDGQRRIAFLETTEAKAGAKGELAIPTEIVIGVPVFDGATVAHAFTARFRHRIEGGNLRLMYKLDRPADVVTAAFDGVVAEVASACGATVLRGTPAHGTPA